MGKKKDLPVDVALETADGFREAAARAEHVARRLFRRTRLLARRASHRLPGAPAITPPVATVTHIMLELPPVALAPDVAPVAAGAASTPVDDTSRDRQELEAWRLRAERAEHAASWLRARLRAERKHSGTKPAVDAHDLSADLTRELARLPAYRHDAVSRVVQRVLATHGLQAPPRDGGRADPNLPSGDIAGWSRDRQEAIAAQALARAPEIAQPMYVYRALALVAERRRATLSELFRASGFDSAMARRRLRLAVEALSQLGVLVPQNGVYTLNRDYRQSPHHSSPATGRSHHTGPAAAPHSRYQSRVNKE